MKIAVITAIFGGMEKEKPFCPQSVECDRIVITEANSHVPLPNLPPRLQAKYFKLQAYRVFPEYDVFVWIDGNIEVTSPDFVKVMTDKMSDFSVIGRFRIQRHHERQTIKEEIDLITASDNEYLTTRYGKQPLRQEYEFYLSQGMPPEAPLYACNIFAWGNPTYRALFFDEWWNLCLAWSWFDQSAFSFLAWLHSRHNPVEVVDLGPMFNNPYFILHPHDNWRQ